MSFDLAHTDTVVCRAARTDPCHVLERATLTVKVAVSPGDAMASQQCRTSVWHKIGKCSPA